MTSTINLITEYLEDLNWLEQCCESDGLEVMSEAVNKYVTSGLSNSRIETIANHLNTDDDVIRRTVLSILKLCLVMIHNSEKGMDLLLSVLDSSTLSNVFRSFLLAIVASVSAIPECRSLLSHIIEASTQGSYLSSDWRIDIDVSQRTSLNIDSEVNFVWKIRLANGEDHTMRVSPEMLSKMASEMDRVMQSVAKGKRTRI